MAKKLNPVNGYANTIVFFGVFNNYLLASGVVIGNENRLLGECLAYV